MEASVTKGAAYLSPRRRRLGRKEEERERSALSSSDCQFLALAHLTTCPSASFVGLTTSLTTNLRNSSRSAAVSERSMLIISSLDRFFGGPASEASTTNDIPDHES